MEMKNQNNIEHQYLKLLKDILNNGTPKQTRNGDTISVFGRQIRHDMKLGFPLLTTKKMAWKSIVTELLWFLRGDTNIKFLVDNGCHIWDGDCYQVYLKEHSKNPNETAGLNDGTPFNKSEFIALIQSSNAFAKKWGELGPVYGKQWRKWNCLDEGFVNLKEGEEIEVDLNCINISHQVDQIANLISELKTNPDSRRLMVNAWNVGELDQMILPPCHYGFQVYTRELCNGERRDWVIKNRSQQMPKFFDRLGWEGNVAEVLEKFNAPTRAISLMWNQRSVDTFLGLPFNIASYGLLLEIIAKEVNMVPDELIGNLGDVHLYSNHIEQAKEQINRTPYELPKLVIEHSSLEPVELVHKLENYQPHPTIKAPLSN
jgi:thymidylate synthase